MVSGAGPEIETEIGGRAGVGVEVGVDFEVEVGVEFEVTVEGEVGVEAGREAGGIDGARGTTGAGRA